MSTFIRSFKTAHWCSARRYNFHIKKKKNGDDLTFISIEIIDLIDNDGKVKELNSHSDEYASQFLTARNTYYVLKIESKRERERQNKSRILLISIRNSR